MLQHLFLLSVMKLLSNHSMAVEASSSDLFMSECRLLSLA